MQLNLQTCKQETTYCYNNSSKRRLNSLWLFLLKSGRFFGPRAIAAVSFDLLNPNYSPVWFSRSLLIERSMVIVGSDLEPWGQFLQRKSNHILLKLFVAALLMGLSFRLFYPRPPAFLPVSEPPAVSAASESQQGNNFRHA